MGRNHHGAFALDSTRDAPYLPLLQTVTFDPVFILGDHRSGTTLLYQLLTATGRFSYVTAFHIVKRDDLLFHHTLGTTDEAHGEVTALFQALGLTDRIFDGVKVTPDLPEEYGFALDNGGIRPQLKPDNLEGFMTFARKVQLVSGGNKPLLLKNPWDLMNFVYLKQVFPQARFIFLHRHPTHVINSQLKASRSMFEGRNEYHALIAEWYRELLKNRLRFYGGKLLFSPRLGLGLRVVMRHASRATRYFLDHVGSVPPSDYISVKYETLCEAPDQTVSSILSFLGVASPLPLALDGLVNPRPVRLLPEVERQRPQIRQRLLPYFRAMGYEA